MSESLKPTGRQADRDPPSVFGAQSTCNVAVLVALFRQVSIESVVVYALSVHKILSFGHVGLLFRVCAHWNDTGLVKKVVCVSAVLHLTPLCA